jgi:hypothetical protein
MQLEPQLQQEEPPQPLTTIFFSIFCLQQYIAPQFASGLV